MWGNYNEYYGQFHFNGSSSMAIYIFSKNGHLISATNTVNLVVPDTQVQEPLTHGHFSLICVRDWILFMKKGSLFSCKMDIFLH